MGRLIIVDGLNSPERAELVREIAEVTNAKPFLGNISTTPAAYVQAMAPCLDDDEDIIIQYGWESRRIFSQFVSQVKETASLDVNFFHMLDRIALNCNTIRLKCNIVGHTPELEALRLVWEGSRSVLPTINVKPGGFTADALHEMWERKTQRGGPGIGSYEPGNILIVGDSHGETLQPYKVRTNIAFCSMSGLGCSEWLTEQIAKANVPESALYWINAYDALGKATDDEFITELEPFKTYALGEEAAKWCRKRAVLHEQVPHPQYWKRFYFHRPYPLIERLKEDMCKSSKFLTMVS